MVLNYNKNNEVVVKQDESKLSLMNIREIHAVAYVFWFYQLYTQRLIINLYDLIKQNIYIIYIYLAPLCCQKEKGDRELRCFSKAYFLIWTAIL